VSGRGCRPRRAVGADLVLGRAATGHVRTGLSDQHRQWAAATRPHRARLRRGRQRPARGQDRELGIGRRTPIGGRAASPAGVGRRLAA